MDLIIYYHIPEDSFGLIFKKKKNAIRYWRDSLSSHTLPHVQLTQPPSFSTPPVLPPSMHTLAQGDGPAEEQPPFWENMLQFNHT